MSDTIHDAATQQLIADDVDAVGRIAAVPLILETVCQITGLRFAAVARVTPNNWTACAVRDEISFGLRPGSELPVKTTLCDQVRECNEEVVIDDVSTDTQFGEHRTPKMYGFRSYISVPILRPNGEFFGTLCALDPLPARLSDPNVRTTFKLFAQLIGLQLEAADRVEKSREALLDAQATAQLREHFVAVLGHDIRSPLSAINMAAEVLQRQVKSPDALGLTQLIQRSVRRMVELVENTLDFARGRLGGGLPITPLEGIELGDALIQVIHELQSVNPRSHIDTRIEINTPVTCDPARIAQLLSNLLGNALTHGAQGEPVTVAANVRDSRFVLSVTNTGKPIPGDVAARMFEPYSRFAGGHRPQGLGLGLYIASQIALAHGGTLTVQAGSRDTTFTFEMPVLSEASRPPL